MKLKEKFEEAFNDWTPSDRCEKIADDYAIDFAEWLSINDLIYDEIPIELLEIFKKEKGL